ncbi:hypothetical protein [Pedobacter sp.]|jgi:hypothetical protein|uniref:hypothetical protein n=1 Tax=Pedobacter sp. TaxID=1411316 RepID=UPI002C4F805D|nr:hypothetical protein [Pedobacter sp.]HWW39648.1 hypothetical protein [Pedobacter sp.]
MQYSFKLLGISVLLLSTATHAGTFKTTCHSRANCAGVNESITWNGQEEHWWRVFSIHRSKKLGDHSENTFMKYGHRCAIVHWTEAQDEHNPWVVEGYHFYMDLNGYEVYDCYTYATGCNLTEGW